jgi:hypothetical protein
MGGRSMNWSLDLGMMSTTGFLESTGQKSRDLFAKFPNNPNNELISNG